MSVGGPQPGCVNRAVGGALAGLPPPISLLSPRCCAVPHPMCLNSSCPPPHTHHHHHQQHHTPPSLQLLSKADSCSSSKGTLQSDDTVRADEGGNRRQGGRAPRATPAAHAHMLVLHSACQQAERSTPPLRVALPGAALNRRPFVSQVSPASLSPRPRLARRPLARRPGPRASPPNSHLSSLRPHTVARR